MSITLEEFIESVTTSGLMDSEEIQTFITTLPMETHPRTAEDLAKELFRHGKLTKFQAQAIYQKKTRGLVVGNYVVLDKLGKGGMGAVYKAKHRRMDRVVALKMLPSTATKSDDAVQRFQRETRAAAKLSHPHIVTAHDADESKGVHFLVMEYVEGQDLHALIKDHGTISVARAVDYIIQAAKGLEYAHSQGVIHRDIKPHNLLLDKKGTVKILDMGLARIGDAAGDAADDDGLTRSGQVMGTLDYMSPEQALDTKTADARADIYSLGCTLHYLLIGRSPYIGDTVTKRILAHRTEPIPSLRKLRSDVPQSLDAVFSKMMAKEPKDRQQSMTEVIRELQACVLPQGGSLTPPALPSTPGSYAETVALQREDTAPPTQSVSPLDELFASEPIQITERLVAPSLRHRTTWTKQQKIWGGSAVGAVVVVLLLIGVILRGTSKTDEKTNAKAVAAKETSKASAGQSKGTETEKPTPEATQTPVFTQDRRPLAEWIIAKGGRIRVVGDDRLISSKEELPSGDVAVCGILFNDIAYKVTDADVAELSKFFNESTSGMTLNLGASAITNEALRHLAGKGFSALILGGTSISGDGLRYFKDIQVGSYLDLSGTKITDDSLEELHASPHLKTLLFRCTPIGDSGVRRLAPLKDLEAIHLSWTRVTDEGVQVLARNHPRLGQLLLDGLPMGVEGMRSLARLQSLYSLWLSESKVTDQGLEVLVSESNSNLTDLHLDKTQITDRGLNIVVGLKNLKNLHITGISHITDIGLKHLQGATSLEYLDLAGTKVTADGIKALKAALPNCKVAWEPPAGQAAQAAMEAAKGATKQGDTPPPAIAPFDAAKAKQHQEAWAKHLGMRLESTNSIGMKLVLIPPGEFEMGSPKELIETELKMYGHDGWYRALLPTEGPQHHVIISKPFYLGVHEVTQANYKNVMGSNPSSSKDDVQQPVDNVRWFDAVAFCNYLSEREGIRPYYTIDGETVNIGGGNGYRLPTEAEWEYACRAGSTTKWHFGDDGSMLGDYAWYCENSGLKIHKVGEKKPNPWLLCDMYGNLFEFCWDWFHPYESQPSKDPMGRSWGENRTVRGSAFTFHPWSGSASRSMSSPRQSLHVGFRLARSCP